MSAPKLSDLLPIPEADTPPNAYQVFGLNAGEPNAATIKAAIESVYASLKESKPTADPEAWKQAQKLADVSRKLLGDPERRCALDSSLEAAGVIDSRATLNADDPLAGLLPSSDRAAPPTSTPPAPTTSTASSVLGVPPMGTPTVQPVPRQGSGVTGWTPPKTNRKRQQNKTGVYLFGFAIVLMLGTIIGLVKYLSDGGRIALTKPGDKRDTGLVVAQPMPNRVSPKTRDDILGVIPGNATDNSSQNSMSGSGLGNVNPLKNTQPSINPAAPVAPAEPSMPMPPPVTQPAPKPEPAVPTPPDKPPPSEPTPDKPTPDKPTPDMPTAEMVQANQKKIEAVEQLIRSANWKEMKPAADALLKLKLTPEQSKRAGSLYDIADLATYYRGGIERGLGSLETGNSFDIVDKFPVIVVEVSAESLSIQYNKKTQTYSLDDLPPRLTEKIASLALSPERPDSIAGLALYRLIHPKTNAEYRQDAVEMLATVDGELETVDSAMLQKVAKELLSQ